MIYRVYVNGVSIYDEDPNRTLISPHIENELNSAGSFNYTIPVGHEYYSSPNILIDNVEVYEQNNLIFFGRVVSSEKDWNNSWVVYCEGALAYLNDSIQRPHEYNDYSVKQFFRDLIDNHNDLVPLNRRFTVGNITIDDKLVYRKLDYEDTYSAIKKMCLDAEGGYLFTRRENGVNYIDWLKEMPYVADQSVQFGLNLIDLNQYIDGSDIVTSVIPLGDIDDNTGERINIKSINESKDYIDNVTGVRTYGRITKAVIFNGITDPHTLENLGIDWLDNKQYDRLTIECDAAELSYLNDTYTPFIVGQSVRVVSTPHLIDRTFPLSKISIDLDSGVKKITIGTEPRKELTEIYKDS